MPRGDLTVDVISHATGGHVVGDGQVLVTGLAHESKSVLAGDLFCCLRGAHADGHGFAAAAVDAGASAVLTDTLLAVGVPQIVVDDTRAALPYAAAVVYGFPANRLRLAGVTGTDGKSTTAHMLAQVLSANASAATIGNLVPHGRNTPEAPDLHRRFAVLANDGFDTVVIEASSAGLLARRLDGLHFEVSIFTNLSQDHLGEVHPTMDDYFAAKRLLFEPARTKVAVINLDDAHGDRIAAWRDAPTVGYRLSDAKNLSATATGSTFVWREARIDLPLAGRFNVLNALAAATAAAEMGVPLADIASKLSQLPQPPGRFERIISPGGPDVIVDYAHTPAGLESLLHVARTMTAGKLTVVFGCGGNRDRAKRAEMGRITARLADRTVLTSDNPRDEDPMEIIADIRAGIPAGSVDVTVEPDRRQAIEAALSGTSVNDLVVVAGKGAEPYQEVSGALIPFDDATVIREALAALTDRPTGDAQQA
jgi:UDP-N-acetylmuramoyl-L-alanyl-D-glutamate--2,6-diaminopimelate ligase